VNEKKEGELERNPRRVTRILTRPGSS